MQNWYQPRSQFMVYNNKTKKMADENILIQIGRNRDLSLWYSNNKTQKKRPTLLCALYNIM